ncbi:anaphase-promoting complex protein [Coniochaeta ligniaria NRRL 30616]|uniref:Anaphase-promoting complex subunit 5 n=1 Tax=Coniochaeta ligniaria NRRL 30616 TaxID=1408157 RepID=A0A1J7ITE2_9PEZI|nr:anaphase-promoting complex protein [Coniochaeta ligniaria NRRL 30616]
MASPMFRSPYTTQRYLGPAKICLLALIELYCENAVGDEATLPVLEFITSHILPNSELQPEHPADKADSIIDIVSSIKVFEQALRPHGAGVGIPGRSVWDIFLQRLWTIDSLHVLHSFLNMRGALLEPAKGDRDMLPRESAIQMRLSPGSPFAAFVSKAAFEYTRLRFQEMCALWKQFVIYRQPSAAYMRRRDRSFNRLSFDSVLLSNEPDWGGENTTRVAEVVYQDMVMGMKKAPIPVTMDDLERLLDFQIDQMQKFGTRIPRQIEDKFRQFLSDAVIVPTFRHYLSFLDAWRRGDYTAALEYMHSYFDNTVLDPKTPYHPYAMLNMAICNAEFGCFGEAVTSILQCVTTARENKDTQCLNYALNWLYHFTQQHPQYAKDIEAANTLGNGREGLAYLRVRAQDVGMWVLCSAALLGEAKLILHNGENVATAFAKVIRSSQLILQYDLDTMLGSLCSVTIALWDRLGLPVLSTADCHHFLNFSRDDTIVEDEIRVVCRLAGHLAAQGKYGAAFSMIETSVDPTSLRTYRVRTYWTKMRAIIHATRELHHNNLSAASQTIRQLLQEKTDDHLEPDLVFAVDALHIDLLMRQNDLAAAFSEVQSLITKTTDGDISVRIRLMLVKAQIYIKSGRPQKALTLAVRAASMARRTLLVTLLWQATGTLADVLTSLGEFAAAEEFLVVVIPRALETDVARLAGALYTSLADARMGLAGKEAPGSEERQDKMTGAHRALLQADEMWSSLEDVVLRREGWAKCAHIMRAAGDVERSDDYAKKYVDSRREEERAGRVAVVA